MTTTKARTKPIRMPGKERPAASQTRIQKPRPEPHRGIGIKTQNPPPPGSVTRQERVTSTDSCGASPVSSALDHSARRDPGGAITNLPCQRCHRANPPLAPREHGKVKQSRLTHPKWPVLNRPQVAGFKVTTEGHTYPPKPSLTRAEVPTLT